MIKTAWQLLDRHWFRLLAFVLLATLVERLMEDFVP